MKDFSKILKGIDDAVVGAVDSNGNLDGTAINEFPLAHLSFLEDGATKVKGEKIATREAGGSEVQLGYDLGLDVGSIELSPSEVARVEAIARANRNDVYLFGKSEAHAVKGVSTAVTIESELNAKGKKRVSTSHKSFKPSLADLSLNAGATAFSTSRFHQFNNFVKNIRQENLAFAFIPYLGNFGATTKAFDASLNRVAGTLYNSPTWGSAPDSNFSKLGFDGVNDYADFGDIMDDDGSSDLLFELWVKILASDGTQTGIMWKKTSFGGTPQAGYTMYRHTDNTVRFAISDAGVISSWITNGATLLQGAWKHLAVAVDRNGNANLYINGVAGSNVSVASIGSGTNSLSLVVAGNGSSFGNFELGAFRIYNFGAGGLPSGVATIISNHYNAEKAIFGL